MIEVHHHIKMAINEIINPQWKLTKQILSVNKVKIENDLPSLDRYQVSKDEKSLTCFFNIEGERYFLAIIVDIDEEKLHWIYVENGHKCYLTATSEKYNLDELSKFASIEFSDGWSKGDPRKHGKGIYDFSRINYRFHEKESYSLEHILLEVIEQLENDKKGVAMLLKNADCVISICRHQYVSANAGISLDENIIRRLHVLKLGIDIDTYIVGERMENEES